MPRYVEAAFEFAGADEGQLSFAPGDVITITHEGAPDEWWEGELNGATGWFPSNFCGPPYEENTGADSAYGGGGGAPSVVRAIALYDFAATSPDELGFSANDIIDVSDHSQQWWTGSIGGSEPGCFPGNYCELLDDDDDWGDDATAAQPAGLLDLSKALGAAVARANNAKKGEEGRATDLGDAHAPPPPPPGRRRRARRARRRHRRRRRSPRTSRRPPPPPPSTSARALEEEAKEEKGENASEWAAGDGSADVSQVGYKARPVDTSGPKARPIWQHAAFTDLFVTEYTETADSLSKRPPPLISLVVSMELISRAAAHLAKECEPGSAAATGVDRVCSALAGAQRIVTSVPTAKMGNEQMHAFLAGLVPQVRAVPEGGTLLIPINVCHASGEAEAVLLAAQRRSLKPGRFSFAVIAGGPCLHKFHAQAVNESTAAFEHHAALVLEHVPEGRITDSAFWYLLFRAQLATRGGLVGSRRGADPNAKDQAYEAARAAGKAAGKAAKRGYKEVKKAAKEAMSALRGDDKEEQAGGQQYEEESVHDGARFLYEVLLPFLNCRALLANASAKALDWAPLPIGGHAVAPSHVASEACRFVMRGSGLNAAQAGQLLVLLRWTILRMADEELSSATVAPSDGTLLRAASRHLASLVSDLETPLPDHLLKSVLGTIDSIETRLDAHAAEAAANRESTLITRKFVLPSSASAPAGACFPFVGRLRRDLPVDHLAGETVPPPILLPVELTAVPESVTSYDGAAAALRKCDELCALMGNQDRQLRNGVYLRLSLLQHTLLQLLPLPCGTPRCFWAREAMRPEVQSDLLRTLHRLSRALLAAGFSLPNTPSLDQIRMTLMAAICCYVDAILLANVPNQASLFCLHYAGQIETDPRLRLRPRRVRRRVGFRAELLARARLRAPAHPDVHRDAPLGAAAGPRDLRFRLHDAPAARRPQAALAARPLDRPAGHAHAGRHRRRAAGRDRGRPRDGAAARRPLQYGDALLPVVRPAAAAGRLVGVARQAHVGLRRGQGHPPGLRLPDEQPQVRGLRRRVQPQGRLLLAAPARGRHAARAAVVRGAGDLPGAARGHRGRHPAREAATQL